VRNWDVPHPDQGAADRRPVTTNDIAGIAKLIFVREVDRLRFLLKQAGIDVEQSLRGTKASERQHVRDVAEERARRKQLAPTSMKYVIGSRIRLQW